MSTQKPVLLVTGGTGLIGKAVISRLGDDYRIFSLDRTNGEDLPADARFVEVDLTSDEEVAQGLKTVRDDGGDHIAGVIHLAAFYDFSGEPSPLYDRVTVGGTARLLEHLKDFEVEQFLFSSTMLVHAPCEPGEKLNERSPIKPTWPYPQSKVNTEKVLRERHGNIPIVIMRIAGAYDGMCHSIPIAQQIRRIYERQLRGHVYPGDTKRGQAFVHIEDIAAAIGQAVQARGTLPPEETFLIGEGTTYSYGDLQREMGRLIHGEKWETYWVPKLVAKAGAWVQEQLLFMESPFIKPWMVDRADDHYALDISHAQSQLGWTPQHDLWNTLPRMVENLKANPERWYQENGLELPDELPQS